MSVELIAKREWGTNRHGKGVETVVVMCEDANPKKEN
jgi:hypothetical protein